MVEIEITYEGDLHCRLRHGPSGVEIQTDAPKDNQGKGEFFSPTDLVAAALGSCMMTLMGIAAKNRGINLAGLKCSVKKEMVNVPHRRIKRLETVFNFPRALSDKEKQILEQAARTCPVHKSLHPEVEAPVSFNYPT